MRWRDQPEDQGEVIVAVAGCLKDNNFRVCQGALSVLGTLVVEMGEDFRPYVGTVRLRGAFQPHDSVPAAHRLRRTIAVRVHWRSLRRCFRG